MTLVKANEATASRRRAYFHLVGSDGITPATGETGGQPQVSSDGGAWTNTGIGTLSVIGNGRYYADLTQTLVATAGTIVETRYKSASTAECPGDSVQVVAFDPNDAAGLGLSRIDAAVSSRMVAFTLPTNFSVLSITGAGVVKANDAGGLAIAQQTYLAQLVTDMITVEGIVQDTLTAIGQGLAPDADTLTQLANILTQATKAARARAV